MKLNTTKLESKSSLSILLVIKHLTEFATEIQIFTILSSFCSNMSFINSYFGPRIGYNSPLLNRTWQIIY